MPALGVGDGFLSGQGGAFGPGGSKILLAHLGTIQNQFNEVTGNLIVLGMKEAGLNPADGWRLDAQQGVWVKVPQT